MLVQDVRYAIRQLRMSPGFTLAAILTLALGIGALTTVATWTNAVLFNPWPQVSDAQSLRFIDATVLGNSGYSVHYDQVQFVRQQNRSFVDAAGFGFGVLNLNLQDAQPVAVNAGVVSANYFRLLGVKPEAGRFFDASGNDRDYSAHDEIVLSDAIWRDRFGGDLSIVGRSILVNRHAFTVVGIAPPGYVGIYGGLAESVWVPLSSLPDQTPDASSDPIRSYGLQSVVRLRPGVHEAEAIAELHTLAQSYALQQKDEGYKGWDLNLRDASHFERGFFGVIGEQLPMLFGASGLLMALVCINIASLLGQRAARRRREVAIRTALGASPARIARQVFAETAVLAVAGAIAGWMASMAMSRALYLLLPDFGMPIVFNLGSDVRIVAFVAAVSVAVTLVCGMFPVHQALRASQQHALHEGSISIAGRAGKHFGRRIILGLQLGLCFIVLVCCGLLTRSAFKIFERDPGFDRTKTLTASLDLSRSGYDEERGRIFQETLLSRLRSAPGVESATLTTHLPMGDWGSGNTRDIEIPGYVPARGEQMAVTTDWEGPDFFRTMRIGIQRGRDFDTHDSPVSQNVAIINEDMARRYWPKGNALGSTVILDKRERHIVGVVRRYAYRSPENTDPAPVLYLPVAQGPTGYGYVLLAIRTRVSPSSFAAQLRQAVSTLDPSVPVESVRTLEDVTSQQYQMSRIPAEILGVYAISSVLVAMLGLYAVMAYSVIERHREFALRMALGSTRSGIFLQVMNGSAGVAIIGLVAGAVGCVAAVRLLRSMLFGVASFDPASYLAAAILLLLTVFLSGLLPARRAATIEPMQALRTE
jgi:macrolide transport system ATP-binding/permease protein